MSRIISQAEIVSEEQLVPRANSLVIKKNNQCVTSDSHITDIMLRFIVEILRHHKLYKLIPPPDPNNTYIKPPLENQILEFIKTLGYDEYPKIKMIAISKMVATRLHQPWRAILSVLNRCLTGKDSMMQSRRKRDTRMAKKVESEKAKIIDEPEEQHVSPVKSGRKKGFIFEDPAVQSLLDLWKVSKANRLESLMQKKQPVTREGSSVAHNKYYDTDSDAKFYSSSSEKTEESANETDDTDKSDMDLSYDNLHGDDDAARYRVSKHNNSTATCNSTYLSPTVTSSSQDFIQTLLDETPTNELIDFMSHPVYTDA
ncbi:hypothetical protein Tco_1066996 [Tanacetum coccineum]|uniref:Uncharacterized protein n=1 Tax=Tanacetum coccineum TaxID=301880 RepID=A0ABQ5HCG9_9ASTR